MTDQTDANKAEAQKIGSQIDDLLRELFSDTMLAIRCWRAVETGEGMFDMGCGVENAPDEDPDVREAWLIGWRSREAVGIRQELDDARREIAQLQQQLDQDRHDAACWRAACDGRARAESEASFSDNPHHRDADMHAAWSLGWQAACYRREANRAARAESRALTWRLAEDGARAFDQGQPIDQVPVQEEAHEYHQAWVMGWQSQWALRLSRKLAEAQQENLALREQLRTAERQASPNPLLRAYREPVFGRDTLHAGHECWVAFLQGDEAVEQDEPRLSNPFRAEPPGHEADLHEAWDRGWAAGDHRRLRRELDTVRREQEGATHVQAQAHNWERVEAGFRSGAEGLTLAYGLDRDRVQDGEPAHRAWVIGWKAGNHDRLQHDLNETRRSHRYLETVKQGYEAADQGKLITDNPFSVDRDDRHELWTWGWYASRGEKVADDLARLQQIETWWNALLAGIRLCFSQPELAPPSDASRCEAWEWGRTITRAHLDRASYESLLRDLQKKLDRANKQIAQLRSGDALPADEIVRLQRVEQIAQAQERGRQAGERGQPLSSNPEPIEDADRYAAWQRGWRLPFVMARLAAIRHALAGLEADAERARQLREASDLDADELLARFAAVWDELHQEGL